MVSVRAATGREAKNGISRIDEAETMVDKKPKMKPKTSSSRQLSKGKDRFDYHKGMRQSNSEKSRAAKMRVIHMLFVIVIEFFICWSPLYIIQTWIVFDEKGANGAISSTCHSFIQLLAYVSSCCNPITYCFMNNKFRQGFVAAFRCLHTVHPSLTRRETRSMSNYSGSSRTATSRILIYDKMQMADEARQKRM